MSPTRFFARAYRLPVYEGVMSARIQEEQEQSKKQKPKVIRDNPNVNMVDAKDLVAIERQTRK